MTTRHRAGRHRSPLICGAGPDSERCGRQHGEALAALCLVIPRRDSTLLLLLGPASPNKLTAGFMARHHNAMLFIQSVISAHGSCQKPRQRIPSLGLAGMKHSGQMAGPTDGRTETLPRSEHSSKVHSQVSESGINLCFWLFNMSTRCTGHITTQNQKKHFPNLSCFSW